MLRPLRRHLNPTPFGMDSILPHAVLLASKLNGDVSDITVKHHKATEGSACPQ